MLAATSAPVLAAEHETRRTDSLGLPQTYVTAFADDVPVGIGRGVADAGWTGVFSIVTVPSARRRGVARCVLSTIARWAETQDAGHVYLQVERSNEAARQLYAVAGFRELATYHYRVRGSSPLPG